MSQHIIAGISDIVTVFLCATAFCAGPFVISALEGLLEAVWDAIRGR